MLKRYATETRLQIAGKAWEIRALLRQETKRRGREAKLSELLPRSPRAR